VITPTNHTVLADKAKHKVTASVTFHRCREDQAKIIVVFLDPDVSDLHHFGGSVSSWAKCRKIDELYFSTENFKVLSKILKFMLRM
jgi:hypothetical protein